MIKIDIDGSRLIYHASVVVSDGEVEVWTSDIAVDAAGNAYVTGYRNTNCIPGEPCDPTRSTDAWVTKLTPMRREALKWEPALPLAEVAMIGRRQIAVDGWGMPT